LRYAGILYQKPENGKYVRWTSGLLSDTYNNIAVAERDYRIFGRACRELSSSIRAKNIIPDIVMGAQM
jgi:orotate phosphoribosyltransferase